MKINTRSKLFVIILVLIAIFSIVVAVTILKRNDNEKKAIQTKKYVDVCSIFTYTQAFPLLGETMVLVTKPNDKGYLSGNNIHTANCRYQQFRADKANGKLQAELIIKEAATVEATETLKQNFTTAAKGKTNLKAYGKNVFWDQNTKQINALDKNNRWFIMSFGSLTQNSHNRAQTEQIADILADKF